MKTGKLAAVAGTGRPAWAIMASSAGGLESNGFATSVGAADDELACSVVSSRVRGTIAPPVVRAGAFEQRVAGGTQGEASA